jgi:hypothetical protein
MYHNIGFQEKRQFFRRQPVKIAEIRKSHHTNACTYICYSRFFNFDLFLVLTAEGSVTRLGQISPFFGIGCFFLKTIDQNYLNKF